MILLAWIRATESRVNDSRTSYAEPSYQSAKRKKSNDIIFIVSHICTIVTMVRTVCMYRVTRVIPSSWTIVECHVQVVTTHTHTHTHTHAHIQIFFLCHRTRFYPLALPCLALPCLARSRGPFFTFPPQSLSFLLNPVRRSFIRISHTRSIARRLSCRVYLNCPYAKCACSCARRAPRKRFIRLLRYRLLKLIKTGNRKPRANIGVFFRLWKVRAN